MSDFPHGTEQEAFEQWLRGGPGPRLPMDNEGAYVGPNTQLAWLGWHARAVKKWWWKAADAILADPPALALDQQARESADDHKTREDD